MHNWWNDYITIPYKKMGRDIDGLDCWGLVRLIYKDQFNIDLPSYANEYNADDNHNTLAELIAISKENWSKTEHPMIGDVLLLRAEGSLSHVGVVISPTHFIHVIEDINVAIERYDQGKWKNRLEGAYRYDSNLSVGDISIVACPNPLKNVRIDGHVPADSTLNEIVEYIKKEYAADLHIESNVAVMVNGVPVPQEQWDMRPVSGDMIQYRAVAGKGALKLIATIAIVVAAAYFAPAVLAGMGVTATATTLAVAQAAISIVGTLLLNAIFPIRPPEMPESAGNAQNQNLLQGGSNQPNPYGAIPVVLGKIRFTAPLGAQIYAEANADTSYLRMLLVWGYGGIQVSDIRIGDTDIGTLEELEIETLNGFDDPAVSKTRFNTIYPNDVEQQVINTQLPAEKVDKVISSIVCASNIVTVVTTTTHGYMVDRNVTIAGFSTASNFNGTFLITEITNTTTFKYAQTRTNATGTTSATTVSSQTVNPWVERTINELCTSLNVILHFPEGLRKIALDGDNAGKVYEAPFTADVQIRKVDPDTLAPLTDWGQIEQITNAVTMDLGSAYYPSSTKVYQWSSVILDKYNKIILRKGSFTADPNANPSGTILTKLKKDTKHLDTTYSRLPIIQVGEIELWRVCLFGTTVYATTDLRSAINGSYSGLNLTTDSYSGGKNAILAVGTISRNGRDQTISLGITGTDFVKRKDAFSYNVLFHVPYGKYQIRIRRNNYNLDEEKVGSVKFHNYYSSILSAITAFGNTKPVVEPKPLAMSALRVKATDQFNGNLEGISATVVSVCLDWDDATSTWLLRPSRNPASLFRYVLQHPANAKAVPDSKIDLNALIEWHEYCETNQFTYDAVITNRRSLLEVLKDICASGRSSPTLKDGVWTVITDKARTVTSQFFTPHNSWGFESTKTLPTIPHAFRIPFVNSEQGFQPDEYIVYNDGYNASNATLYEQLSLNGVTVRDAIHKHARFHFAQIKLRPETYTLNADIEHLVCTRGDLVKVSHDVPMWGLGSGRIVLRNTSTQLEIDEFMAMSAGVQYTIRIRLADGSSITRTVAAKSADGLYNIIDLTASVTTTEATTGNLFMFGALNSATADLIVQSIEPISNLTARITLVDYSPAVYDSDSEEIPAFESKITLPPTLMQQKIFVAPTISGIVSDESVMMVLSPKNFMYRIKVSFTNPAQLPFIAKFVEGQIDYAEDNALIWQTTKNVPIRDGCIYFDDVQESSIYKIRLRYVTDDGRAGPWVYSSNHTVVGKTNPPSTPTGLSTSVDKTKVKLQWDDNPEVDVYGYEVRTADSGWGSAGYVYQGVSSEYLADGVTATYYIKAIDVVGLYSVNAASIAFTINAVTPVASINFQFQDTSLTNASITLDWTDVAPQFGLSHYIVTYDSNTVTTRTSKIILPADWIGNKVFSIKTVDLNGNQSTATNLTVTKLAPNPVLNFRAQVIDNNILFYWDLPAATTLPVQDVLLKRGNDWNTATIIGSKSGGFTSLSEVTGGNYTYWVAVRDTDDNYSEPHSLAVKVSEPPDFVFHASYSSTFGGTKSSAINDQGGILIPVNTTESWTNHFSSRSWADPAAQIAAGYPVFIQPSATSGYYEEMFDYGTILNSSQVTVTYTGDTIASTATVSVDISVSDDNVTYTTYNNVTSLFASAFRYVKIKFNVSASNTGVYLLNSLDVLLNAKLMNDAGNASAVSTDANGTLVNFNKEFLDVISITVSPNGTTVLTPVYNFQDAIIGGTYSVSSNVVTINATGHDLIAGQKVRLNFTSGTAPNGVYSVASVVNANQYTVNITTSNTSGNISTYPEGFRVYLFNSTGTRVSGTISWSVKGY
jgi:sulfur carrier protein ThiS